MGKWLDQLLEMDVQKEAGESFQQDTSNVMPLKPSTPHPSTLAAINIALERACQGYRVTPDQLREHFDSQDIEWIASGRMPMKTARAYVKLLDGQLNRVTP